MPSKRTIPRVCRKCGEGFLAALAAVNEGGALYCSARCYALRRALPIVLIDDGATALIAITRGDGSVRAYTAVDAADAAFASQWCWSLTAGYATRQIHIDGRPHTLGLHRALLGLTVGDAVEVDHRDRDKLNNRRTNLRVGPHIMNTQNKSVSPGTSSVHRGVSWYKANQKWGAYIRADGRHRHLGLFATEEEAAAVAREARRRLMPFAVD